MKNRVRLSGYPLLAPTGWLYVDDYLEHGALVVGNHAAECGVCGEAEKLVEDAKNWPKVEKALEEAIAA